MGNMGRMIRRELTYAARTNNAEPVLIITIPQTCLDFIGGSAIVAINIQNRDVTTSSHRMWWWENP